MLAANLFLIVSYRFRKLETKHDNKERMLVEG
jgi:hypothetical protein